MLAATKKNKKWAEKERTMAASKISDYHDGLL
jgi:hypothetical protein